MHVIFNDLAGPAQLAVSFSRRNQRYPRRDRGCEGERVLQHGMAGFEFKQRFISSHARALATRQDVCRHTVVPFLHQSMLHAATSAFENRRKLICNKGGSVASKVVGVALRDLTVYYDSECAFCQWARHLLQRLDHEHRLTFIDFREDAEASYSQEVMTGAMHVLDPDGKWSAGYDAFVRISRALPGLRPISAVLMWCPVRWLGTRLYRLVARNRYGISSLLFRVAGVPRLCGVTCDATQLSCLRGVRHGRAISGQSPIRL